MQHALITPQSESEQLATLAAGAMETASQQQTRTAGSATYHNPNGTKTLIGADASGSGIATWVGDTTPPGRPTGVSAESGAGLVLVSWDGSLDGGVPPDFDHVQILVDGKDAGRLAAKGTLACGPYEPGTEHTVTAVAWDDAHAEDGSPAPNASPACTIIRVTATGADVDPSRLGITVTKSDKEPQGQGAHTGDLWLRYTAGSGPTSALSGEWWWDGSKWVPIPIAIYLDQLAARDVQVDEAVVGMLAAGIIKSGTFVTADGLVGFDSMGFWAKNGAGDKVFTAGQDGVRAVGGFATATSGNRIIMSQTLVKGTRIGGIQGQDSDDTNTPNWFIWGYGSHTAQDGYPSLQMGVNPQMPEIQASRGPNGSVSSLTANYVTVQGSDVTDIAGGTAKVTARRFEVRGIPADFADYDPSAWMGWSDSFQDYNHATRLYKRAGVYFLELAIKIKYGIIPPMQTIPVVRLASSIMPDHSLDVLAYGTSYAVGRVHVFGPGESQPQGTISIGTKDTTANFFSAQLFWNDPRKA